MDRTHALEELSRHAEALRARGAASAYLFGSTARGEAGPDSDLDLFIDVEPGRKFSLLDLIAIKHYLQDILRSTIDVTTRRGLHPMLRADIEREAIRIY